MAKYLFAIILLMPWPYSAHASDIDSILDDCSKDRSHADMSECVQANASASSAALKSAESALLTHISKRREEPVFIARMKKTFEDGTMAFQQYRQKQCDFYASMAAGGNSAGDLRLACITDFNNKRIDELQWASHNWE